MSLDAWYNRITRAKKQNQTTALALLRNNVRRTFLDRLPTELWLMIVDLLDADDAASLALCSASMASMLLETTLPRLNDADKCIQKSNFLTSFDRHYPNHLLCFYCQVYHRRDAREEQGLKCNPTPTSLRSISIGDLQILWTQVCIKFRNVQLAVRAHRYRVPKYGISLAMFEERCRDTYIPSPSENVRWTRIVRAALTPLPAPHLILRIESLVPAAEYTHAEYEPEGRLALSFDSSLPKCPHVGHSYHMARMLRLAFGKLAFNLDTTTTACCKYCPSNYMVEIVAPPAKPARQTYIDPRRRTRVRQKARDSRRPNPAPQTTGSMLRVTAWFDLGDGLSPHRGEWFALRATQYFDPVRVLDFVTPQRADVRLRFDAALAESTAATPVWPVLSRCAGRVRRALPAIPYR